MLKTTQAKARKVPAISTKPKRNALRSVNKRIDDVNCATAEAETTTKTKTPLKSQSTFRIRKFVVRIKRIKQQDIIVAPKVHIQQNHVANRLSLKSAPNPATGNNVSDKESQTFRNRKFVVRLKRIKAQNNIVAPKVQNIQNHSVNRTHPSRLSLIGVPNPATSNNVGDKESQTFRIRKFVVPLERIKQQENVVAANVENQQNHSVNRTYPTRQILGAAPTAAAASIASDNVGDVSSFEPTRNSTMCTTSTKRAKVRGGVPETVTAGDQENVVASKSRAPRFFHRDQPPSRTRSSVTRNVYEFLSQSQIEDNEVTDPAADIIKQMVKDGKACVMVRCKGKFRARTVRKKVRPMGRRKQCSLRSIGENQQQNANNVEADVPHFIEQPLSPIYEPQIDSSDDDENEPNEQMHFETPVQVHAAQPQMRALPEGVYSPLARTMLLNQTKNRQNTQKPLGRRRDLLDMAKRFVSTPMNRKSITSSTSTLSPIDLDKSNNDRRTAAAAHNSPSAGSASPWRIPDELGMPNTFVFGLNTSQLPSYSSDFIKRRPHVYVPNALEPEPEPEPIVEETTLPDENEQSASLGSNDSNGENVPPAMEAIAEFPVTSIVPSEGQENENLENFIQLPNPRRTLQHRSPLKDINILEVVMLPSWKKNVPDPKTPTRESIVRNQVHFEDSIENSSPRNLSSRPALLQQQKSANLFGFEDFLDDDNEQPRSKHGQNHDVTLHEKLQRIKGLRPADKELPQISKAPMRYDYDDLEAHQPRQRNIKEMFCSTMIGTPPPHRPSTDESVALFKDMEEPDTTFDEKKPRRTYVRERAKRKRKRVHVLFIESDESDSEDNEQDSKEKNCVSPGKAKPPQKRPRKDAVHEAKLKQFITSFNQECAEVEKYPLVVE